MNQRTIIIIISIIWGFGLSCLLKHLFHNGETIILKLPKINKDSCVN